MQNRPNLMPLTYASDQTPDEMLNEKDPSQQIAEDHLSPNSLQEEAKVGGMPRPTIHAPGHQLVVSCPFALDKMVEVGASGGHSRASDGLAGEDKDHAKKPNSVRT